ncbi:MAG: VWA domain-containing protein, partial [Firmicutes bacterium]|nr:VWA domain-containing protein [Bacillota bacterium]
MHWMNPTGAAALPALALILSLYVLKQKMEPAAVSSTYLWERALQSMEADTPFQKLKRSLLLFLQLLLALLLALSLMRPMTLGGETGEVMFVFDISASMQANDGNGTRLDAALTDARRRVDGLKDGARVSILTAGARVSQPLARASDRFAAKR